MKTKLFNVIKFKSRPPLVLLAAIALAAMVCPTAQAANGAAYYLDPNGTTAGFGPASGTYSITNIPANYNWTTAAAGDVTPIAFNYGTSPYGQLTFGSGTASPDLTGTFSVNLDAVNNRFSGIAVNSSGVDVTLTGTVATILGAAQTWSVVSGSTLTEADRYSSFSGINFNNLALTLNGAGTINFGTSIAFNSTALVTENMSAGGVVNLLATNLSASGYTSSFKGGFTLTAGTLNFASAQSAYAFRAFTAGKNFSINGGTINNTFGSPLTVSITNGGAISVGGSFAFTGSSDLSFDTNAVTLTTTPTVTVGASTLSLGGVVSGAFGLTKTGNGTLSLNGANTYSGTTTINGGALNAGAAETAGVSGPLGSSTAVGSILFGGGALKYSAANQFDYSSRFSTAGSQSIKTDIAGQSVSFGTALSGSGTSLTLADSVGAGILTLSTANTYTGNTTISGGTLALGVSGSLDSGSSVNVAAGATFDVSANTGASGTYTWGSSASLTASGSATTSATIRSGTSATVDLTSRSITLNISQIGQPALIVSQGSLNVASATIAVNNDGPALDTGDYTLISGGVTGTPATTSVTVGGTGGLVPSDAATLVVSGGNLILHVTASGLTSTTTTLTRAVGNSPSTYGDSLTFHAVVSPNPGNGSLITFKTNGVSFGTATTTGGSADLTVNKLQFSGGLAYGVTAIYAGDGVSYSGSTGTLSGGQQVDQKELTVASATAQNKVYDGTAIATVGGTLVGVVSGDSVTLNGTGAFASPSPGTGIAVTFSVTGLTTNYTFTQPAGVTADIYDALVWNGGSGVDNNWSDATNWVASLSPLANNKLTFDGSVRLNNTNNTPANTAYSQITFNAGAGAFVLNGNSVVLAGNVVNNSANPQTINFGLNFDTSRTLDGGTAGLIVGGGLTNTLGAPGSTTLTLAGAGTITNLLGSANSPGGTNLIAMNSSTANWTLVDNASSTPTTAPWAWALNNGTFNFGTAGSAPNLTLATVQGVPADPVIGSGSGNVATFNLVNGVLTTTARLGTGLAAGTANINVSGGLWLSTGLIQNANSVGAHGNINVTGGTLNLNAAGANGKIFVASRGTGTLTVSGTGQVICSTLDVSRGTAAGSAGTVNLNGGTLAVDNINTATSSPGAINGSETATLNLNGGILQARRNDAAFITNSSLASIPLNVIVQAGGALIDTSSNSVTSQLPLQHDSALGVTPDGGLVKLGSGALTLAAANNYTGSTTVSNGTLFINGSTDTSSAVTVKSGGAVGGTGTVGGATTVQNGGTVSPGATLGTLTFNGNLTLNAGANALFELNTTNAPATNDYLVVTGTQSITASTITVSNIGPALVVGDSFTLLSNPTAGFTTVNLPVGYTWTNKLALDGSIQVLAVTPISPDPTNITYSVNNNQLVLDWPVGQGWQLQAQTNSLATGLSTNWVPVPGATPPYTNNVNPAASTVFYRLVFP